MKDFPIYGLGEKLKTLRTNHNMTQKELAERFEVNVKTVGRWENDSSLPSLQVLVQYASMFNTSLDYLVGFSKDRLVEFYKFTNEELTMILDSIDVLTNKFKK